MKKSLLLLFALLFTMSASAQTDNPKKKKVIQSVEKHSKDLINLSDKIWSYAEIAFKENQSAEALATFAEQNGFNVTRGVGEIPTAFTAEFGSGEPIIGIMGEFDALPGLSQDTEPFKKPIIEGAPWAVVATGGMSIGHKGLVYASKALAMTMVDLFESEELREEVKNEHKERVGDYVYEGIVPPGPPPLDFKQE